MQERKLAIYFTHCIAHKVALAVLESVKSDTNLEKLQSTLSVMFLYCSYLQQKRREIQEISSFLNKTIWQFSDLKNVHCLVQEIMLYALSRIECNNSALVIHQGNITNSNDKNAVTAKGHVMDLKLVLFIFFLPFYDRLCLKTASNSFALIFQKDHLLVYSTNHIIESCIEIFKVIKKQLLKTTYVFLIIPRKKMVISFTRQQ